MARFPPHGLYAITDGPRTGLLADVEQVLAGGARLLQYRDFSADHARRLDEARALKRLCDAHQVPLLINGDALLAEAGAVGGGVPADPPDDRGREVLHLP